MVDGNHPEVRDLIWRRADTIVWLDYRLALIMWRLTLRTFRRVATREVLWNGNRERDLSAHFFSRDSIFLWALRTYGLRRREYPALLASPSYAHLRAVRLPSPRATNIWLESLPSARKHILEPLPIPISLNRYAQHRDTCYGRSHSYSDRGR